MPGPYQFPESLRGYADFLERLKKGATHETAHKPKARAPELLTIPELVERYRAHCLNYYRRPGGVPTGEHANFRCALRPLLDLFSDGTLVMEFQPAHLEIVREEMIRRDWSRKYINKVIGEIKRLFKWSTSKGMVSPAVYGALATVEALEAFRSEVRETSKVEAVSDDVIEATLPELGVLPDRARRDVS
jgi:hypothetical protein